MKPLVRALWTEPVLFLSAVAALFTVGGGLAVTLGAPAWVALVCGAIGPVVSSAARSKTWAPKSVHDLAVRKQTAESHRSEPERVSD